MQQQHGSQLQLQTGIEPESGSHIVRVELVCLFGIVVCDSVALL